MKRGLFKKKHTISKNPQRNLVTFTDSNSIISEQFRTVRTNINFSLPDKELKSIVITSSTPGEGKSTNAANIAVVFAQEGKKVLLVDADMRKPTIHYTFQLQNSLGLSNVLANRNNLVKVIQESFIYKLHIITSGPIPPNPTELLLSKNMDFFIEEMKKKYDVIIFDAPPVLSVSDPQILAHKCDGTLLIINTGVTEKENVMKAKEILLSTHAKLLGVILNNYKLTESHYHYQTNYKYE
ncbi:CpsD/CapB family tyrosine-protein kinase [Ureibacillus acetophenoni]|uniref:non-specific protein-tyrosine kinase n=1 Tax=Ureibacillus acetophenoni TaxID=614649 RepID=A0A285U9H4_9BACL|nr:CpsD/CapB family tyrosine-protein kinase [Ureibacillus acetophenoni]SOC38393.1 capsular exopolysaccharide synthesis family protein [Ureibacillus acetophenoni]